MWGFLFVMDDRGRSGDVGQPVNSPCCDLKCLSEKLQTQTHTSLRIPLKMCQSLKGDRSSPNT